MRIARRFTEQGKDVYQAIEFRITSSEIRNPDGSVVFQARNIEVPASWSQVASSCTCWTIPPTCSRNG